MRSLAQPTRSSTAPASRPTSIWHRSRSAACAGRTLHDDWAEGAEAFLGLTVSGYPNLFLLYGPNTNGVNSILFMHEAQAHYIMRALRLMTRRGHAALEVRGAGVTPLQRAHPSAMAGTSCGPPGAATTSRRRTARSSPSSPTAAGATGSARVCSIARATARPAVVPDDRVKAAVWRAQRGGTVAAMPTTSSGRRSPRKAASPSLKARPALEANQ